MAVEIMEVAIPYENAAPAVTGGRSLRLSKMTIVGGVLLICAATVAVTTLMLTGQYAAPPATHKFAATRPATRATHRAASSSRRATTRMELEAGVLPPTGFFDPWGFSKSASAGRMRWFQEAELKHGRIAMLAAVGFLIGENPDLKTSLWPGHPELAGSNGLAMNTYTDHNLDAFWNTFVLGCGLLEARFYKKVEGGALDWTLKEDYAVGDLGFDPLNLKPSDATEFTVKRTVELQNGRLAMLAIAGFNAQEMTDGKPIWPFHRLGEVVPGTEAVGAAELNDHIVKGLDLVKEMGAMLAETQTH